MAGLTASTRGASTTGIPIVVDVSALRNLARDLRRVAPEAYKELQAEMKVAGEKVAADARERVSYSPRIQASIRVRTSPGNFKVQAGGDSAPDAAPIENGGKGFVRHPVFGDREAWTSKNSHPAFLAPALEANAPAVAEAVDAAISRAAEKVLG